MDITDRSIRCSYYEAEILGQSLLLEKSQNHPDLDEIDRLLSYIWEKSKASDDLARADIKFLSQASHNDLDTTKLLEELGTSFLQIPRIRGVERIISKALSNFVWCFTENTDDLDDTKQRMLNTAAKMSVEFMVIIQGDDK